MSIQSQIDLAVSGSTIEIAPGEYRESIFISKPLTLIGNGAIVRPNQWSGFMIQTNNVTIQGFEVIGAQGPGIWGQDIHHATVRNCKVHACGESGISFVRSDWLTIEDNECFMNAINGWFSGISLYQNISRGTGTADYRNKIRNNVCYDNVTKTGAHTDGNGIIIDDFQNNQNGSKAGNYPHKTLVDNNLCFGNGGKGIQVTWSDNVTIINNTCFRNNVDTLNTGTWRADISVSESKNAVVENNIAVAKRGSGMLAFNRAYANTAQGIPNNTTFLDNIGWDPLETPSVHTDGNSSTSINNVQWIDPKLDDKGIPTITTDAGWRPITKPQPEPEPEPVDLSEILSRIDALEILVTGQMATISDLSSRVIELEEFDKDIKDL